MLNQNKTPVISMVLCIFSSSFLYAQVKDKELKLDAPNIPAISTPAGPAFQTQLKSVSCDKTEKDLFVTLLMDKKPLWKIGELENHGSFYQLTLVDTLVSKPGTFVDCIPGMIDKVAPFQGSDRDGAIRIFVKEGIDQASLKPKIESLDNRIVISFELAGFSTNNALAAAEKTSTSPIKTDKINLDSSVGGEKENAGTIVNLSSSLNGKMEKSMKKLGVASLFLLSILVLVFLLKPYFRGRKPKETQDIPQMRILSNLSLTPKQKITLVSVGQERLLLSVTPEGIRLLKTIEQAPTNKFLNDSMNSGFKLPYEDRKPITPGRSPQIEMRKGNFSSNIGDFKKSKEMVIDDIKRNEPMHDAPSNIESSSQNSKINIKIDDDGIHDQVITQRRNKAMQNIDDVTKMIREKLKDFS